MFLAKNWRDAMQDVAAKIDEAFGEPVVVEGFLRKPNMQATSDPLRPPVELCAVFCWRSEMAFNNKTAHVNHVETAPLIETRKPCFRFRYGVLPYVLSGGSRITRRGHGTVWEVTGVKPDGVSMVEVEVVQLGREPADYVSGRA